MKWKSLQFEKNLPSLYDLQIFESSDVQAIMILLVYQRNQYLETWVYKDSYLPAHRIEKKLYGIHDKQGWVRNPALLF